MNSREQLCLNYNYVKGVQGFMKEAGMLKYASEDAAEMDANSVASAMIDESMNTEADKAMEDNKVLEVATALVDLSESVESPKKEVLEDAAANLAEVATPDAAVAVEEEKEMEAKEANLKLSQQIAAKLRKSAGDSVTNPKPDQVLTISDTDYQRATMSANAPGTGQTTLQTEKGEIGSQENVESKNVLPTAPNATGEQVEESEDIFGKDYAAPGKGQTDLKTEKGEIGAEENVDSKLAGLALQSNLARLLRK